MLSPKLKLKILFLDLSNLVDLCSLNFLLELQDLFLDPHNLPLVMHTDILDLCSLLNFLLELQDLSLDHQNPLLDIQQFISKP